MNENKCKDLREIYARRISNDNSTNYIKIIILFGCQSALVMEL